MPAQHRDELHWYRDGPLPATFRPGEFDTAYALLARFRVTVAVRRTELRTFPVVFSTARRARLKTDMLAARDSFRFHTAWQARVNVIPGAASMRIGTAVPVSFVRDLPVDPHNRIVEINICPAQPQRLVLPEAERERHRPPGTVPAAFRKREQRSNRCSPSFGIIQFSTLGRYVLSMVFRETR